MPADVTLTNLDTGDELVLRQPPQDYRATWSSSVSFLPGRHGGVPLQDYSHEEPRGIPVPVQFVSDEGVSVEEQITELQRFHDWANGRKPSVLLSGFGPEDHVGTVREVRITGSGRDPGGGLRMADIIVEFLIDPEDLTAGLGFAPVGVV